MAPGLANADEFFAASAASKGVFGSRILKCSNKKKVEPTIIKNSSITEGDRSATTNSLPTAKGVTSPAKPDKSPVAKEVTDNLVAHIKQPYERVKSEPEFELGPTDDKSFMAEQVADNVVAQIKPPSDAVKAGPHNKNHDTAQHVHSGEVVVISGTEDEMIEVTGAEKMSLLTRIHFFEHAVMTQTKLLCSQIEALPNTSVEDVAHASVARDQVNCVKNSPGSKTKNITYETPKSKDAATTTAGLPIDSQPINDKLPLHITSLRSYSPTTLATTPIQPTSTLTFPHSLLLRTLGGHEYSPSLYYPATSLTSLLTEPTASRVRRLKHANTAPSRTEKRTYYLFDATTNPYVPLNPGDHGAALSLFFRDFDHPDADGVYVEVPVFVALPEFNQHRPLTTPGRSGLGASKHAENAGVTNGSGAKDHELKYTYMGQYTQSRWSDRLSPTESANLVSLAVRTYWISLLTSPSRPAWLTRKLAEHLEPRPLYFGTVPAVGDEVTESVRDELEIFFAECREWEFDSVAAVENLDKETVKELLGKADADSPAGLRWWWEYLECVGFDRGFVYALGTLARGQKLEAGVMGAEAGGPGLPEVEERKYMDQAWAKRMDTAIGV